MAQPQLNERVQVHPDGSAEVWRDILEYVGLYRISDRGRVMSLPRRNKNTNGSWITKPKILMGSRGQYGHTFVSLRNPSTPGLKRSVLIHRLVLEMFIGPCPDGMECRHLDGNPLNNRLDNLRWGTHLENMEDRRRHGSLIGKMAREFTPEYRARISAGVRRAKARRRNIGG